MAILTEQEARRIVEAVMERATADDTIVNLLSRDGGNTRFAGNGVTTSGEVANVELTVTSAFGSRSGSAETNGIDDEAIAAVVARAEEAARLAPEDPEYVPPLESADYPRPPAYFESTAAHGPSERADTVAAAIEEAVGRDTDDRRLPRELRRRVCDGEFPRRLRLFPDDLDRVLEHGADARRRRIGLGRRTTP